MSRSMIEAELEFSDLDVVRNHPLVYLVSVASEHGVGHAYACAAGGAYGPEFARSVRD
jgi:hypothetical protein